MKKLIFIYFILVQAEAYTQIDWKNYSSSFNNGDNPTLGVAVPYNGIYDNTVAKTVGIAHWNPQNNLDIDATLHDSIPLYFVNDTAGIYFLAPKVNQENAHEFEYCVLLNNKTVITAWSAITQFTETALGTMRAGSGMMGPYSIKQASYMVTHLRKKSGEVIASWVLYFKERLPEISSLYTASNPLEFSHIINSKDHFGGGPQEIGWHRQYHVLPNSQSTVLKLAHNENTVLLNVEGRIYKKEALEYSLRLDGKIVREWGANETDNNYILLKNLAPGDYTIHIRLKRQQNSITEFRFSISATWYKTAAFRGAIFAFLVLLLTFLVFILKYRKQKKAVVRLTKKAEQSAEALKNIHALLNPHFTFNALSSIQALINKGDVDAANTYLSSFGELLRETLKESNTQYIPLEKELANLKTYISLEQLRHSFGYEIKINEEIDLYSSGVPPFILQPFVENAIKHGFANRHIYGELKLRVDKKNDNMLVEITDNGAGFNTNNFKQGYGVNLSKKRIELINAEYGEELITLQIESNSAGTSVLLSFKNWL